MRLLARINRAMWWDLSDLFALGPFRYLQEEHRSTEERAERLEKTVASPVLARRGSGQQKRTASDEVRTEILLTQYT